MIQAGIIGASGYTGAELARILSGHPEVELSLITSRSLNGTPISAEYGNLRGICDLTFTDIPLKEAANMCDVLFIALPHGVASRQVTREIIERTVIIDLGADFRLKDQKTYETWYRTAHGSPDLLASAVYGLSELHAERIASAQLIANPGCYTTCSILCLAPLVSAGAVDPDTIIVDAKSGVSGAGRTAQISSIFGECNESVKAYGITTHRHTPEIEEQLTLLGGTPAAVSFTPHLIPMNRGILVTAYVRPHGKASDAQVRDLYEAFYAGKPFIRILPKGRFPETRWVKGSNFLDIGIAVDERTGLIIVIGALDNLVKGASGQAVQNMNIRFSLPEAMGLENIPGVPM